MKSPMGCSHERPLGAVRLIRSEDAAVMVELKCLEELAKYSLAFQPRVKGVVSLKNGLIRDGRTARRVAVLR